MSYRHAFSKQLSILPALSVTAADRYAEGFLARCNEMRSQSHLVVNEAGLTGVLAGSDAQRVRLLVSADEAHDALSALLPDVRAGMIRIFRDAEQCVALVADRLGWESDTVTAMVCRDLRTVPALTLPGDLELRPVRRLAEETDGVALAEAVTAAISAAGIEEPPEALADYLRALPSTFRLFAALSPDVKVRATSGAGVFGHYAEVIFVNTDRDFRGRGIAAAMTAQALRAAQGAGARHACLEASDAARSLYLRLGFESAGTLRRFYRR